MEVGPGSGWALANADLPPTTDLTLLDLNSNSLGHTSGRLSSSTNNIEHDVLEPLDADLDPFDSISLNYVLHCLPGDWATKDAALTNLAAKLRPDGILFGSTVLGVGQRYSIFGRALMAAYNQIGAFNNRNDDLAGLTAALNIRFTQVEIKTVGNVAIFVARNPT